VLPPAGASLWRALPSEIASQYPVWMLLILSLSMLNMALANLGTPRWDLAWQIVFPFSVFAVFYGLRARHRPKLLAGAVLAALLLLAVTATVFRPSPLARKQLLLVYEFSNFVAFVPLAAHALRYGRGTLAVFFGPALLYGVALENGGIAMGYFDELAYELYFPGLVAPLATMIGWVMVIYLCTFWTWQLRRSLPTLRTSPLLSAVAFALCGVLFDLQIDPVATASGCWIWEARLPAFWFGVPAINFVAWFCALAPFGWGLFRTQMRHGIDEGAAWPQAAQRELLGLTPVCLGLAAVLFLAIMATLEGGWNGPTYAILGEFLTGLWAKF